MNLFTKKHYPIFVCKITPFYSYRKDFEEQNAML